MSITLHFNSVAIMKKQIFYINEKKKLSILKTKLTIQAIVQNSIVKDLHTSQISVI